MLVAVALLMVAVVGAVVAARDWPLWNALRRVRPTTPERLARLARDGHLDGRLVAVTGVASAGPDGALLSIVNEEPCVWHRYTVHRRHISYRGGERGSSQRYSRPRRVADRSSPDPFLLRGLVPQPATARHAARVGSAPAGGPVSDGAAPVEVRPVGMRVHRPAAGDVRILPGLASDPFPAADALMGRLAQLYWHREWVLRPGVPLLVLGEVDSAGPRLVLRRPARGPHIVSTRTVAWLRRRLAVTIIGGLTAALLAGVTGGIVVIGHYV